MRSMKSRIVASSDSRPITRAAGASSADAIYRVSRSEFELRRRFSALVWTARAFVGRCGYLALLALAALVVVSPASAMRAAPRDDTAWLQEKLDAGGTVSLPKLANGQC